MTHTLQEDTQKIKIRDFDLKQCSLGEKCITNIVNEWQHNGCPGCVIKHTEVLKTLQQKNVDTLIVADTMYSTLQGIYNYIILVSADYDMLPGILFANIKKQKIVIFRKYEKVWFDRMLLDCEIKHGLTPCINRRKNVYMAVWRFNSRNRDKYLKRHNFFC